MPLQTRRRRHGPPPPRRPAFGEIPKDGRAHGARGHEVDDGVPEAHEWQDEGGDVVERVGDVHRVREVVDAVDGAGDPCHAQRDEEEHRHLGVAPCRRVGLERRAVSLFAGRGRD